MSSSATAPVSPGNPFANESLDKYHRRHRSTPSRSLGQRFARGLGNVAERLVVGFSVHGDVPVFDSAAFPWVKGVEADWARVRLELDRIMTFRDQMPSFQDIMKEVGNIQQDDDWKTFFLKAVGMDTLENARHCPETMKLLDKIPGCTTAFFSILSPGKHIPAHRGPYVGVLRLHLALLVPEPREQCRIRIANRIHVWEEGKVVIFDDTYNHEVWNDTKGYRVVLFVDFERPLRAPMGWLNHWFMNWASVAPFLREAKTKQKAWEKKFYGGQADKQG